MLKKSLILLMGLSLVSCNSETPQAAVSSTPSPIVMPDAIVASPTPTEPVQAEASASPSAEPSKVPEPTSTATPVSSSPKVTFSTVNTILQNRCTPCHITSSSGGANFTTKEEVKKWASQIKSRVVDIRTMPQGNVTGMTDAERQQIEEWFKAGASID